MKYKPGDLLRLVGRTTEFGEVEIISCDGDSYTLEARRPDHPPKRHTLSAADVDDGSVLASIPIDLTPRFKVGDLITTKSKYRFTYIITEVLPDGYEVHCAESGTQFEKLDMLRAHERYEIKATDV